MSAEELADKIAVFSDGQRRNVFAMPGESFVAAVYAKGDAKNGHILYSRATNNLGVWAVPFSLGRLETTADEPFLVADGTEPSVGDDGTLLFVSRTSVQEETMHRLVWIDEELNFEPEDTPVQPMGRTVELGDDENLALVSVYHRETRSSSIYLHDLRRGNADQITRPPEGASDSVFAWFPDGVHFLFRRNLRDGGEGLILKGRVDGEGEPEVIAKGGRCSLSTDGKYLVYEVLKVPEDGTDAHFDIVYRDLDDDSTQSRTVRGTLFDERNPQISPDGRLLAFNSGSALHLTRFPSGEGRWTVSLPGAGAGGSRSFWGKDPTNMVLYYYNNRGSRLNRVAVKFADGAERPEIGTPEALFSVFQVGTDHYSRTAPSRDGKRFLAAQYADFVKVQSEASVRKAVLVENWLGEFDAKAAAE